MIPFQWLEGLAVECIKIAFPAAVGLAFEENDPQWVRRVDKKV